MSDGTFFDEKQLLQLGWPMWAVQAVKRVFESEANQIIERVEENAANIEVNKGAIEDNTASIDENKLAIDANTLSIAGNSEKIAVNTGNIEKKADKITPTVLDNFVSQSVDGNIKDSGVAPTDYDTQIGDGSPEGTVTANRSLMYIDKIEGAEVLYFNPKLGSKTGWIPV